MPLRGDANRAGASPGMSRRPSRRASREAASADDPRPLARDGERDLGAVPERRSTAERDDLKSRAGPIEGVARRGALVAPRDDAGLMAVGLTHRAIADEAILGMDHDIDEIAGGDGSIMRRDELASRLGSYRGASLGQARQHACGEDVRA